MNDESSEHDGTPDSAPDGDRRSLAGRIAIVAGAGSSGPGWSIGKACCVTLARRCITMLFSFTAFRMRARFP